ncbi:MAG: PsbP-related protein [Candidatus Eisenbacteria bacterium]
MRNRTIILMLIAIAIEGLTLPGCSRNSAPEPGRYYDRAERFSIRFPEDWMIREGDGEEYANVEAVSPWESDYDEFSEYVTVDVEELEGDMDLAGYFELTSDLQTEDTPAYRETGRGDAVIDDINAKWIAFDFEDEGGPISVLGYALVEDNNGYLISCVAQTSKFARYKSRFDYIVNSFRPE